MTTTRPTDQVMPIYLCVGDHSIPLTTEEVSQLWYDVHQRWIIEDGREDRERAQRAEEMMDTLDFVYGLAIANPKQAIAELNQYIRGES